MSLQPLLFPRPGLPIPALAPLREVSQSSFRPWAAHTKAEYRTKPALLLPCSYSSSCFLQIPGNHRPLVFYNLQTHPAVAFATHAANPSGNMKPSPKGGILKSPSPQAPCFRTLQEQSRSQRHCLALKLALLCCARRGSALVEMAPSCCPKMGEAAGQSRAEFKHCLLTLRSHQAVAFRRCHQSQQGKCTKSSPPAGKESVPQYIDSKTEWKTTSVSE